MDEEQAEARGEDRSHVQKWPNPPISRTIQPMKRLTTARLELFAQAIARGESYADAYRQSHPRAQSGSKQAASTRASRLAATPAVKERVAAILKAAKVNDIDSIGAAMRDLLADIGKAREEGDNKAVMAGQRLRVQMLGGLQATTIIVEENGRDRSLLERLAKGKPELAAQLEAMLSGDGFDTETTVKTIQ